MAAQSKNKGSIWIIGAGFMGRGIAQICAQHKISVCLIDPQAKALAESKANIIWSLKKLRDKGRIDEDPNRTLSRIDFRRKPPHPNEHLDFLVECVPEDFAMKQKVLSIYDGICALQTIFATNTSALPIGKLASTTTRPDKFIGTHFASPPVIQKLVEIIPCLNTTAETLLRTRDLLIRLEREIIEVKVDTAGFIMNRIYLAAAGEAIRLYARGAASVEDIDRAMRIGYAWSKGPLEAADLAGLDIIRGAMNSIWEDTADPRFHPPEYLTRLVEAGRLGLKTGYGFYEYDKGGKTKKS